MEASKAKAEVAVKEVKQAEPPVQSVSAPDPGVTADCVHLLGLKLLIPILFCQVKLQ